MKDGRSGFIILLAAVVIAVLALLLSTVVRVQAGVSPALRAARERAELSLRAESVSARLIYLLLTEPIGARSIVIGGARGEENPAGEEVRLDGRFYAVGDGLYFSVQDESGLININSPLEGPMAGLLSELGLSDAQALAAALADYTDEDDLVRAGGAEGRAYRRQGLPPPANETLPTRWSVLDVMGWRERLAGRRGAVVFDMLTALPPERGGININTAPAAVLGALFGREAAAIESRRDAGVLLDAQELAAFADADTGPIVATRPVDTFRITVVNHDQGGRMRFMERRLTLAADEANRPFYWSQERQGAGDVRFDREGEPSVDDAPRATLPAAP